MDLSTILAYAALVFIGSYIQTQAGFAIAMIIAGGATLLNLAPVAFTANIIAIISVANIAGALHGRYQHIDLQMAIPIILGILPGTLIGLWGLYTLSAASIASLELLLGIVIFFSGLTLTLHPARLQQISARWIHGAAGGGAGLLMGMFSTGGPPLILHLYRQPVDFTMARSSLLFALGFMAVLRLIPEAALGHLQGDVLYVGLLCVPASILGVVINRHLPLPLDNETLRRIAFGFVSLLGLSLVVSRISQLL